VFHLDELKDWCRGEVALLICGSPSAPSDVRRSNWESAHWISVNQHAALLPDLAWAYAHDPSMIQFLREDIGVTCPIVSPQFKDLKEKDIYAGICPWVQLSGPEALWTADYMGYKEIWLCGVDNYENTRRDYWHQYVRPENDQAFKGKRNPRKSAWGEIIQKLRNPKRVKTFNPELNELLRAIR